MQSTQVVVVPEVPTAIAIDPSIAAHASAQRLQLDYERSLHATWA